MTSSGQTSPLRSYTLAQVAARLFSGEYDHLTVKQFRERFPLASGQGFFTRGST